MEKESLVAYKWQLYQITSPHIKEADFFFIYDTAGSAYKKAFKKVLKQQEEDPPISKRTPLLILTDELSHTGRWAMAADGFGFQGIVLYTEEESDRFLLTYFGDGPIETVPLSLSALALPDTDHSRQILVAALRAVARTPGTPLLEAVDLIRKKHLK